MDNEADGGGVQLVYQSPLFTDLQNIVSNRTNSVALPMTAHNLAVIDIYERNTTTSGYQYRRHDVIYKRDGLQLLRGKATVLSVGGGKINMCFTWGNTAVFQQLIDTKLRDLGEEAASDYVWWVNGTEQKAADARYWADGITFGVGVTKKHPMLPVSDIMTRIESRFGLTGLTDVFADYVIPLQGLEGMAESKEAERVTFKTYRSTPNGWITSSGKHIYCAEAGLLTDIFGRMQTAQGRNHAMSVEGLNDVLVTLPAGMKWDIAMTATYEPDVAAGFGVFIEQTNVGVTKVASFSESDVTQARDGDTVHCTLIRTQTVSISVAGYANATTLYVGLVAYSVHPTNTPVVLGEIMTLLPNEQMWDYYSLWRNLPDWTCAELVKQLIAMQGLYAASTKDNVVEFVSVKAMRDKRGTRQTMNWTERLMTENGNVGELSFAYGNYARENALKYADDDSVIGYYDAKIAIENELLEPFGTMVELSFSANDGANIPLYAMTDGEAERQDIGQRILLASETYPHSAKGATFSPMIYWPRLMADYYGDLATIVRHPVVIKANVHVSTADLTGIDLTNPVYLRQTGHYYAILSMTVATAHTANVELLQL